MQTLSETFCCQVGVNLWSPGSKSVSARLFLFVFFSHFHIDGKTKDVENSGTVVEEKPKSFRSGSITVLPLLKAEAPLV